MKRRFVVATLIVAASLYGHTQSVSPPRIETRTRLVALFSDLNQQVFQAIQASDTATFQKLVADDFELCYATAPDSPQTRDQWLETAAHSRLKSFRISQMAVRGWNEVAVASFLLEESYASPAPTRNFVVQAWSHEGENWVLQQAYISRLPGKARTTGPKDKKPTGKE